MNDSHALGESETWVIAPLERPLALDWSRDGDEWQRRLTVLITQRTGAQGFSAKGHPDRRLPGLIFTATGGWLTTSMWAVPLAQGMLIAVEGMGVPSEEQIRPWVETATEALAAIGTDLHPQPWVAIVGVKPGGIVVSPAKALASDADVSGLRMSPVTHRLVEGRPPDHPSLYQTNFYTSWPIVVRGTETGFDWWRTARKVFDTLHPLCGLLSLATGESWVVREGPAPDSGGQVDIPDRIGVPDDMPADVADRVSPATFALPEWFGRGLDRVVEDPKFASRLAGFQEGMEAQAEHPSLAAIAFVAVIESIGVMLVPPRRCTVCGTTIGSGRAFKRALREALPEDEAKLLGAIYVVRSKTAHEGKLHGSEVRFGMTHGPSFWTSDPSFAFEWQQVWPLRKAAGLLLERDITEPCHRRSPQNRRRLARTTETRSSRTGLPRNVKSPRSPTTFSSCRLRPAGICTAPGAVSTRY